MTPSTKRVFQVLVPAAVALVAIAAAEAAVLSEAPTLRVDSAFSDGRGVHVTVSNPAPVSRSGILTARIRIGEREVPLTARVVVPAGATIVVDLPFDGPCTLLDAGIVLDDGAPL